MSTIERSVADAMSDARLNQADARNRVGDPAPTPEAVAQERLAALAASCPAAGVAAAVVAVNGWPVVPLDPTRWTPRPRRSTPRWRCSRT